MTTSDLPDAPTISEAVDWYLTVRDSELSRQTLRAHRSRLGHLVRWANNEDTPTDAAELTPRQLYAYRQWRQQDGNLSPLTLQTQLSTLRVFVRTLEHVGVVPEGRHETIELPEVANGEGVRETMLNADTAAAIDAYLRQYEYASVEHVYWTLLYQTGCRMGAARAVDVGDVSISDQTITFRHRPADGTDQQRGRTIPPNTDTTRDGVAIDTPLKNGTTGERHVAINDATTALLDDYINDTRPSYEESDGRQPLLTTHHGRPDTSTLRRWIYRWTQPCQRGEDCPHGTNAQACETAGYTNTPSGCPSIVSPHAIRKLVVVNYKRDEVPTKYIEDRCNVSEDVIDKHYDMRDEREKTEQRRDYFG